MCVLKRALKQLIFQIVVFTFRNFDFRFPVLNSGNFPRKSGFSRKFFPNILLAVSLRRPGKNRKNALFFSEFRDFGTSRDISEIFLWKTIQDLTNFTLIFCCVHCAERFYKTEIFRKVVRTFVQFRIPEKFPQKSEFSPTFSKFQVFRNSGFPEIQDSLQLSSVRVYEFHLFKELAHKYYPL
jgi:hypothetical protein